MRKSSVQPTLPVSPVSLGAPPLHILLIEDSQEDVNLAKEVLDDQRIRNRLQVIDNGDDALSYLKGLSSDQPSSMPDVIVLDLNIPRKNGFAVLHGLNHGKGEARA